MWLVLTSPVVTTYSAETLGHILRSWSACQLVCTKTEPVPGYFGKQVTIRYFMTPFYSWPWVVLSPTVLLLWEPEQFLLLQNIQTKGKS